MAVVDINGKMVEFPDSLSPDQLQAAVSSAAGQLSTPKKPLSFMQKVGEITKGRGVMSPLQMIGGLPQDMASMASNKIGEFAATDMARRGANPYVSAGVGTALAMAPDLASLAINPLAEAKDAIPNLAIKAERRALGFRVPELKTLFARGKAAEAAKVALEQGVTSATGNPDVLFNKANDLAAKSGQQLGAIRKSAGLRPIEPIIEALDEYKAVRLKGASGGKWDAIANKIEEAKKTVEGLVAGKAIKASPEQIIPSGLVDSSGKSIDKVIPAVEKYTPPTSLNRIAEAKKEIGKAVNWLAENVSQSETKKITGVIENASEKSLAEAGGDIGKYKQLKKIYGASKSMLKGLNREVAVQEGNRAIGLPSLVAGASGGPATAAATAAKIGGMEFLNRRGAGIAASEIMSAANAPKNLGTPLSMAVRILTRDEMKKLVKDAPGDTIEEKRRNARQIATDNRWSWPGKKP